MVLTISGCGSAKFFVIALLLSGAKNAVVARFRPKRWNTFLVRFQNMICLCLPTHSSRRIARTLKTAEEDEAVHASILQSLAASREEEAIYGRAEPNTLR